MSAPTARGLRVAGGLLVLVAISLGGATEWAARRDRAIAERLSSDADTTTRASARYHAAHAEQTLAARWDLTGHGTLGVLGMALGVAMMSFPRSSRPK